MNQDCALTRAQVRAEALLLDNAERQRRQVRQSTIAHPDMTLADDYRVQDAWRDIKIARGERLIGHKVGLTSRAMQLAMHIDTPDSGFLTDAMVHAPNEVVDSTQFCDLRLEVELAFVLGHDLSGRLISVEEVLDATEYVIPAVEMIAARTPRTDPATERTRTVVDTVADNAASAGIIVGGKAIHPRSTDLARVGAIAFCDDVVEDTGLAGAIYGHPARGVAWLANTYTERGRTLRAGDVILPGSFTRPLATLPGLQFYFDFGDLGAFQVLIG